MRSDADYAKLCQYTYNKVPCDLVGKGPERRKDFGACIGQIKGVRTVAFQGTKTTYGWTMDALALPWLDIRTTETRKLGQVHAGFLIGATSLLMDVQRSVGDEPYALCGHSLGGALAILTAGFMTSVGKPPVELVTFGCPRAGMYQLRDLLKVVPTRQYRFGYDPVPMLPLPPYRHIVPLIQLGKPLRDLFANHGIVNYISALEALPS